VSAEDVGGPNFKTQTSNMRQSAADLIGLPLASLGGDWLRRLLSSHNLRLYLGLTGYGSRLRPLHLKLIIL